MTILTLPSRIEAATPARRDRSVDALRALAILGVVLGHWLVTAFVVADGELRVASPLSSQPLLVPVSWLLQTLAVFFLVGGYAAARSLARAPDYRIWLRARMARLVRPVLALLAFWVVVWSALDSIGLSNRSMHSLRSIVLSPLWFLAVYAGLTVLTPIVVAARRHLAPALVPALVLVVAAVDLVRFGLDGPAWLGWVNLLAGWLVPYCLGVAWSAGAAFRPIALLAGGAAATVVLGHWFGYPASMVGVPGDGRSNLNPPTLAAVTFGLAQVGLALLLRRPLTRLARRPLAWTGVALVNLSAMTVFLWHQTALIAVTTFALGYRRLPGLHTLPDGLPWVLHRLAWLPAFVLALAGLVVSFHRFERARPRGRTARQSQLDGEGPVMSASSASSAPSRPATRDR